MTFDEFEAKIRQVFPEARVDFHESFEEIVIYTNLSIGGDGEDEDPVVSMVGEDPVGPEFVWPE